MEKRNQLEIEKNRHVGDGWILGKTINDGNWVQLEFMRDREEEAKRQAEVKELINSIPKGKVLWI